MVKVAPCPSPSLSDAHRPAVQLDEVPDDGHAEPEAAVPAGRGSVRLAEAVEDVGQEVG